MTRQRTPSVFLYILLLFAFLLQGAGKREALPGYAYLTRTYEVFPHPAGFRVRGYDLLKILDEAPLFLYPLSGFHFMGGSDFQLLRIRLVRRDPETRNLSFLSDEEHRGFPYKLYEEAGVSGDVPFVTFHMEDTEAQMILEMEWELIVPDRTLQFLFHTGTEYLDGSQILKLHNPEAFRRSSLGPLVFSKEGETFVWSFSLPSGGSLSPGEMPEVTLSLKK